MTVIIALEHPETGEKAIASDGRSQRGDAITSERTCKLRRTPGGVVIGVAGMAAAITMLDDLLAEQDFTQAADLVAAIRKGCGAWKAEERDGEPPRFMIEAVLLDGDGVYSMCMNAYASRIEVVAQFESRGLDRL